MPVTPATCVHPRLAARGRRLGRALLWAWWAACLWLPFFGGGCGGKGKPQKLTGGTSGPDIFYVDAVAGTDFNLYGTAADPYGSIQRALAVSGPGDVIMVAAGTYHEILTVPPFVEIRGASAATTFIDGDADGPIVTFAPGAQPANSGLRDVTLQNGKAAAASGILTVQRGSPNLVNLVIQAGDAYGSDTAAAVQLTDWGAANINNLTINTCNGTAGQVVAVRGNGIVNPTIANLVTAAGGVDGGLVLTEAATFTVSNSWVRAGALPAIELSDSVRLTTDNSTYESTAGDGAALVGSGTLVADICTLGPCGGHAVNAGGLSRVTLNRTRLTGATGAGLRLDNAAAAGAVNSIFDHNQNGVLLVSGAGGPGSSFIHCTIADNTVNGLNTSGVGSGTLYVFNSLITYNGTLAADQVAGTHWVIENSGLTDATGTGGSNLTIANPQYTNKAGGDYTIPLASAAVNLGNPNLGSPPGSAVPGVDFAGVTRSTADNPDSGAHEGQ